MIDRISLILVIIGALNWGSIGLFKFDIVAWICGGQGSIVARIIYTLVALAGIWCISLFFKLQRRRRVQRRFSPSLCLTPTYLMQSRAQKFLNFLITL